ncbi:glycolate oxidase subunit GlcD [Sediminibacillus massiliensis]|uniref:glycolate oxidase subunit GlcD n=1 Tax=Sediminibacillus massiliensis TaxID=1926277 RepID=UPI0009887D38|nr:glycolate oxidase subunit GlcD [Sediminibacillus massiliensis]
MLDNRIIQNLIKIVGDENVATDNASLLSYSYDATPNFQSWPDVVVSPKTTEEIAEIVKLCASHNIPLIPRGSGTNLSAGTTPLYGGIILLMKHLDKILEIDEANLTVTTQPGVITLSLMEAVEAKGLFYPPDPSSMKISQIGGNINENSGGLRGLKYGVTRDYVLGLEFVTPSGNIVRTGGKLAKDVAGYDLTGLMVGSEGTLGVITEATLKLLPKPDTKKTLLALFTDIDAAAETVSKIIENRIIPATLEFLDRATLQAVEEYAKAGLPTHVEAVLLIEQDGKSEQVESDIEQILILCREQGAVEVRVAKTVEEAEQLTTARRAALSALARIKPTTILEDATVPRSEVARMVKAINIIADQFQVDICTFGHAGDGNLHPTCLTDARNKEEMQRVEQAFEAIFKKAVDLGGTITGEHGVGAMKAPYLHLKAGKHGVTTMKAIKQAFDPQNIMNPGKLFSDSDRKRVVISKT